MCDGPARIRTGVYGSRSHKDAKLPHGPITNELKRMSNGSVSCAVRYDATGPFENEMSEC